MKKTIIGIVIGIIISTTTVYAASILSSSVVYDNSTSNGSSKTVQGALDELYDIVKYGDAIASNILEGKTALVQGQKVTGTMELNSCKNNSRVYVGNTLSSVYTVPVSGFYNIFAHQYDDYGYPQLLINNSSYNFPSVYYSSGAHFSSIILYLNKGDIVNNVDKNKSSWFGIQYIACE